MSDVDDNCGSDELIHYKLVIRIDLLETKLNHYCHKQKCVLYVKTC